MSDPFKKLKGPVQRWLNQFADRVDYNRFTRGLKLFDQKRIHSFQMYPNHFVCNIRGKQDTYEVIGTFRMDGGLPAPDEYTVTCSCPDDAFICKHAVCATIHFILVRSEGLDSQVVEQNNAARTELIEVPLMRLREKLEIAPNNTLHDLPNDCSHQLMDTGAVIREMHNTILSVLDEVVHGRQGNG
ncbi:SWIM zinc finger family protein [Alkalihalobacillus sp. AL-G]|uniref:SWIM zinc finger family protein n=1 Tax=Alkalihalobacillus sp. AL-G TaxID=2926399 RepID=UPI00272BDB3B|nr:SWIM zinc finger family protein [Alkalihalobacillus sp. AL-G]WLD91532.1 SWIM zinc finger family protein [Alkalihalobacillus sp. AL-G]